MHKLITAVRLLASGDDRFRYFLMRAIGSWLVPGYRFHWHHLSWLRDAEFSAFLERFGQLDDSNAHRYWMLDQLQQQTRHLSGDTAECGVFKGAGSYLICKRNAISPHSRRHHVFDSFQGISDPGKKDGQFWSKGDLSCPMDTVTENLSEFGSNAFQLYPGWIPERFSDVEGREFSFVHVDVDLYEPTLGSLKFFYPRLQDGGILVCDDYGFLTCPGATAAMDEFLEDKPEPIVTLPCGGGYIVRRGNV